MKKRTLLYIFSMFLIIFSNSSHVYANGYDEQFYGGNGIFFYDPRSLGCTEEQAETQLSGSDGEEQAFNFFVGKGLTTKQSAGLVGNLKAESGVLPARIQGAGVKLAPDDYIPKDREGFGIAQWTYGGRGAAGTPPYKDRQGGLINFAKSKNTKITDLGIQLEYVWKELSAGGVRAGAGDELKASTTIRQASDAILIKFESPLNKGPAVQAARAKLGNEIYGKYADLAPTTGSAPDSTSAGTVTNGECGTVSQGDIVEIAKSELAKDVKEIPIGCDAGNPSRKGDCGAEVNKYTDNTLEYWCADFVSWVYKQAGKPFTGGSSGGWRIAGVSGVRAWFEKNGVYTKNGPGVKPNPGDAYMTAGEQHIGIVERVEGNIVYTISGNTSIENNSNGVGVGAGSYKIGSGSISGYGSLKK